MLPSRAYVSGSQNLKLRLGLTCQHCKPKGCLCYIPNRLSRIPFYLDWTSYSTIYVTRFIALFFAASVPLNSFSPFGNNPSCLLMRWLPNSNAWHFHFQKFFSNLPVKPCLSCAVVTDFFWHLRDTCSTVGKGYCWKFSEWRPLRCLDGVSWEMVCSCRFCACLPVLWGESQRWGWQTSCLLSQKCHRWPLHQPFGASWFVLFECVMPATTEHSWV